ncbi:MAG: ribose ABC transporter permease, partial [Christensenellaceae bacterium]|nr:ribose ABC transporter permease [Christensenellaceae bacterium]
MQAKNNRAGFWATLRSRYSIIMVLMLLFVVCSLLNENFLTWGNLTNISRQISVTTILAFGETILIICGLLDLSSGSVIA